jgi:hypothetical protein
MFIEFDFKSIKQMFNCKALSEPKGYSKKLITTVTFTYLLRLLEPERDRRFGFHCYAP